MLSRREWLRITAGAGAALSLNCTGSGSEASEMAEGAAAAGGAAAGAGQGTAGFVRSAGGEIMKPIPSTGEEIPVIGLGGRWISTRSTPEELADHRAVLHALAGDAPASGRLFDSAAGYGGGASEHLSGDWAVEDGFPKRVIEESAALLDLIESGEGVVGQFGRDRRLKDNLEGLNENLDALQRAMEGEEEALGHWVEPTELRAALGFLGGEIDALQARLESGHGSGGRFLHDDELFVQIRALRERIVQLMAAFRADPLGFVDIDVF